MTRGTVDVTDINYLTRSRELKPQPVILGVADQLPYPL